MHSMAEQETIIFFISADSLQRKGAHIAIQVARRLNRRLILAGNLADEEYFKDKILPFVDGNEHCCETEVDDDRKKSLISNASCLTRSHIVGRAFWLVHG